MRLSHKYRRMTPWELSEALEQFHLSRDDFGFIIGSQPRRVGQWVRGEEEIPHFVRVFVELFHRSGNISLARGISHENVLEGDDED